MNIPMIDSSQFRSTIHHLRTVMMMLHAKSCCIRSYVMHNFQRYID